jgi:hypothetical protein
VPARHERRGIPPLRSVSYALIVIGAILRLRQYLANQSLSIDEALLALNLIERSPGKLLSELDFTQAAPIGFLETQKLAITVLGKSEYVLRLLPLLVSLASLVVFYWTAKKFLTGIAVPLALAAFALVDPLVYYSATAKQYAFDVAIGALILGVGAAMNARAFRPVLLARFTAIGAVGIWLSHASAFVFAAVAAVLAYHVLSVGDRRRLPLLLTSFGIWAVSLTIELTLSRTNLENIRASFAPSGGHVFLGGGGSGPTWFDSATSRIRYFAGLEETASGRGLFGPHHMWLNQALTLLVVALVALGFVSMLLRRTEKAVLLGLPAALVLVASALDQYPLSGRTLLFLLAPLCLAFGEGCHVATTAFHSRTPAVVGGAVVLAALISIAIVPALRLVQPRRTEETKPVLRYLERHRQSGDGLYIAYNAQYSVAYYHLCGCGFDVAKAWPFSTLSGSNSAFAIRSHSSALVVGSLGIAGGDFRRQVGSLSRRPRVWLLFADTPSREREPFLAYARKIGRPIDQFTDSGAAGIGARIYQYRLRG